MDFTALKQELSDRGFTYLTDARLGQYINWARAELDDTDLWPYREAFATGAPPLAISDLGTIEKVLNVDTTQPLIASDYGLLLEAYGDLSTTGTATYYYTATPAGTPEVATFPVGDTIGVQYWKVTPDLTADSDTPLAPTRFHRTIVNIAVRMAYRDADDHAAAEQLQAEIERDLLGMRVALVPTVEATPGIRRTVEW